MKIGKKLLVLWAASMTLFISTWVAAWQNMNLMDGVSGLVIRFFLGYCGIIVVAQVFSALASISQLFGKLSPDKPTLTRELLR